MNEKQFVNLCVNEESVFNGQHVASNVNMTITQRDFALLQLAHAYEQAMGDWLAVGPKGV